MRDPRKIPDISEDEARRIIEQVDVAAFLNYTPFAMEDARAEQRLAVLRDEFLPLGWNPAKQLLGFSVFLGASRAGDMCELYAQANGIDLQREFGMDMWFANPYELVGEMLGIFQPNRPTPRSIQGLRLEPYLRNWLESEHGYRCDHDNLEAIKNTVHPDRPLMRATPDELVEARISMPRGEQRWVKAVLDFKCTQHEDNYQSVSALHYFQSQQQLLMAEKAGVEVDCGIVVYYDYDAGLLRPHPVFPNHDIRQMIEAGYDLTVDHIDAGQLPAYQRTRDRVEMTDAQREDIYNKAHLLGSVSYAHKELTAIKSTLETNLKTTLLSITPQTASGELNTRMLFEGTPLPPTAFNATSSLKMVETEVEELAKKRGIWKIHHSHSDSIADFAGLEAAAQEVGLDLTPYRGIECDYKACARQLETEFGISPQMFSKTDLRVFAKDASNLKNEAAAAYSKALKESVKKPIAVALDQIVTANDLPYVSTEKDSLVPPKAAKDIQPSASEPQAKPTSDPIHNDLFGG